MINIKIKDLKDKAFKEIKKNKANAKKFWKIKTKSIY